MVDLEWRKVFLAETTEERTRALWELFFLLEQTVECIGSSMKQWMAIRDKYNTTKDGEVQNFSLADISQHALEPEDMMVGHENSFDIMMDKLSRGASGLEVVSIVGMGGIGKTTLAMKIYADPFIMSHFDTRAKCSVSQEYYLRNVLLGLLSSIIKMTDELPNKTDAQLADQLQKLLKGRRYFIVIDDIWTKDAWGDIKLCFPDYDNGSRILLTSRIMGVAEYASSGKPHRMSLLNFDESWSLLPERVFLKDKFSPEFEQLGKSD